MSFKVNSHVTRLTKFLPFGPGISEIITELQKEAQKLNITTRAIEFIQEIIVHRPKAVLLTGNAGHGKTYICEQLLKGYAGLSAEEAKASLRDASLRTDGLKVDRGGSPHTLRIHKDLSEVGIPGGAEYLLEALTSSDGSTAVICVNEGRLRAVLSEASSHDADAANTLRTALDDCIEKGIASSDASCYIVNLNFQSVVAPLDPEDDSSRTILGEALHQWIEDRRSWTICSECEAADKGCPIYNNRQLLARSDTPEAEIQSSRRRHGIEQLFQMAELSGHVTTIREMLMALAYIVTGDLSCDAVKQNISKHRRKTWYADHAFHQLVFGAHLDSDSLARLPILSRFKSFDPGLCSIRKVDDRFAIGVDGTENDRDLHCMGPEKQVKSAAEIASGVIVTTTGSETGKEESDQLVEAMIILRRRDFFDLWAITREENSDEAGGVLRDFAERAKRIGFESLAELVWIQQREEGEDRQRLKAVKRYLIAGLQAVQGLAAMQDKATQLNVTDPAFSRFQRRTSLIRGKFAAKDIELRVQPHEWERSSEQSGIIMVNQTVNWLGREIVLSLDGEEIKLDLERFEYLVRAGRGYLSRSFYATDIRRLLNFLGLAAGKLGEDATLIQVKVPGGTMEFSISEGLIQ